MDNQLQLWEFIEQISRFLYEQFFIEFLLQKYFIYIFGLNILQKYRIKRDLKEKI